MAEALVRNVAFGVEDSVLSTMGFVASMAAAGFGQRHIMAAGCVSIMVSSVSMAAGSFIAEDSAQQVRRARDLRSVALGAAVMFASYVCAGGLVMLPIAVAGRGALTLRRAAWMSTAVSVATMFALGCFIAWQSSLRDAPPHERRLLVLRGGVRTMLLGAVAAIIALGIGRAVKRFAPEP
jgi:hypothetical protein